jgi:hypothetical protein
MIDTAGNHDGDYVCMSNEFAIVSAAKVAAVTT